MFYFHVLAGNKHIDLVQADNEEQAIALVLRVWGKPIKYSVVNKYSAVRA